ncbi:MAG: hypothetical protein AAF798_06395 [Bacteroidota bacterium]
MLRHRLRFSPCLRAKSPCQNAELILWLLLSLAATPMLGQEQDSLSAKEKRRELARVQINELKAGTLVVRIPSDARKIYATQKLLESETLSESARERLENQLAETTEESNERANAIMAAFRNEFNFTKVFFMYDYSMKPLLAGEREGLFLAEAQKVDPDLRLGEQPFFVLRLGKAELQGEGRLDALVFMDAEGKDLYKPFPYYLKLNTVTYLIDQLFYPSKAFAKNILARVKKLNARLYRFHESVGEIPRP